jgi:UDP-N-acetylglucosamine--N-acetylmuramyl-(pentapeptide) pyrophosphoryl-undecaprenol N-acetylglucosamine transferase
MEEKSLPSPELRVIISGGGTGGHIFPALAIANELKKRNPANEVLFVGAKGRMEMEKVPAAGYRIVGLDITGISRSLSLQNILLPFRIIKSVLKARSIIKEFKPNVAIGVGGYASGPLLFAATSLGIPSLIQEQNSFAGITNKLLAGRVRRICVAYEGMEKFFPSEKIMITGNPVRQDAVNISGKREEAMRFFGLDPGKSVVLVIGGSLGARTINESIESGLGEFRRSDIQLIWQTGRHFADKAKVATEAYAYSGIVTVDFINRMDLAYAAADVVVSRAGASSVSELAIVAKPAILVPSPNVAEDHQTKNALALVNRDAAMLVTDAEARANLVGKALGLVKDMERRRTLSENIAGLALKNAAEVIAGEVYTISGVNSN